MPLLFLKVLHRSGGVRVCSHCVSLLVQSNMGTVKAHTAPVSIRLQATFKGGWVDSLDSVLLLLYCNTSSKNCLTITNLEPRPGSGPRIQGLNLRQRLLHITQSTPIIHSRRQGSTWTVQYRNID